MSENKLRILALDQAEKCGFCCGDDVYGEWSLKTLRDEGKSMKLIRFRSKIKEIVEAHDINLIVFERTAGRFKDDITSSAKLVAVIEMFCEDKGIDFSALSATDIKQFATGSGKATKADMIKAAKDKYGYTGDSDNTADAIHIYHYAKKLYS